MGIPNKHEATFGDGQNDYVNVNTVDKRLELVNGATLQMYSDAYNTGNGQIGNGTVALAQSATAPDPGAGGTITTNGVGLARVNPAAARTGVILQQGTVPGQMVVVENLAASANSITFAAAGTSFVADGTSDVISGGTAGMFIYDSSAQLWYRVKAS